MRTPTAPAVGVPATEIDLRDPPSPPSGGAEDGHGRPRRSVREVAASVRQEALDDDLSLIAAGVAFFALLSLVPAMVAALSLYGLVASREDAARLLNDLTETMPSEARQVVRDQLVAIVETNGARLSAGFVLGLVVALWGASTAMQHLLTALTRVYDEHEDRSYARLRGRALAMTMAGIAFLGVAIALLTVAPTWMESVGGSGARVAMSALRWPVLLALMMAAVAFAFRYGPDRAGARWRWVSWGSTTATLLWLGASAGFSMYASHFGSYNKTYGSMAGVVVLMLWLYITALCVLLGGEIDAELEQERSSAVQTRTGARP